MHGIAGNGPVSPAPLHGLTAAFLVAWGCWKYRIMASGGYGGSGGSHSKGLFMEGRNEDRNYAGFRREEASAGIGVHHGVGELGKPSERRALSDATWILNRREPGGRDERAWLRRLPRAGIGPRYPRGA
jgi:hypothetical protein